MQVRWLSSIGRLPITTLCDSLAQRARMCSLVHHFLVNDTGARFVPETAHRVRKTRAWPTLRAAPRPRQSQHETRRPG